MIVYDFEVFKYDWLVVIKDITNHKTFKIVNNKDKLQKVYDDYKRDLWIGFNNKRYDDLILKGILLGANPYSISTLIIEKHALLRAYQRYDLNRIKLITMDISQDAMKGSLKEFEGYMGLDIEESSVPFNINRPLYEDEIEETFHYCNHDVDATINLVKLNWRNLKVKMDLVKDYGLGPFDLKKTNAQLVEKILDASKYSDEDEFGPYVLNDKIMINDHKITDFYTKKVYDYSKKIVRNVAGIEHTFRFGGLHAALTSFIYEGEMWQCDVSSYYPSLMIYWNLLPRGIPDKYKELVTQIYHKRIAIKHGKGDKRDAAKLKLILNTLYGCMKSEYNGLYDPRHNNDVCITGQLLLTDLIEKLDPYAKLIQSNTDGILIIPYDKEKCTEVLNEWQDRTKMPMDIDICTKIFEKDVNNYILVHKDGSVKVKGSYVAQYKDADESNAGMRLTRAVVDDAVCEYFLHDIPVKDTIMACTDIKRFQIISKTGSTYDKTVWYNDGVSYQVNKVNRVFASKLEKYGKLYKLKLNYHNPSRALAISLSPEHCLVDNAFEKASFDDLDYDYYITLANNRIKDFKGVK